MNLISAIPYLEEPITQALPFEGGREGVIGVDYGPKKNRGNHFGEIKGRENSLRDVL